MLLWFCVGGCACRQAITLINHGTTNHLFGYRLLLGFALLASQALGICCGHCCLCLCDSNSCMLCTQVLARCCPSCRQLLLLLLCQQGVVAHHRSNGQAPC